ncbi:MAG: metallophosphoesterase [Bacteroidetes bacterium]|nr:metallophosphoesterase [Bacteroidota bacterium]
MIGRFLAVALVWIIVDMLVYSMIPLVFRRPGLKKWLRSLHFLLIGIFFLFTLTLLVVVGNPGEDYVKYRSHFLWLDIFLLIYLPKMTICLLCVPVITGRIIRNKHNKELPENRSYKIFRRSWLIIAALMAAVMFLISLDGMVNGISRFRVTRTDLYFADLPPAFDGFTVAQLSDIHLGSWIHKEKVLKGLQLAQDQHPDLIVITGDLINVHGDELKGYGKMFSDLGAPMGKFAILGNHDMGDFMRVQRGNNLGIHIPALKIFFKEQGIRLLRNEHVFIKKGNDSIVLAGVDNWSVKHFVRYGRLDKALGGINGNPFTILLSHDPSHWQAEILKKSHADLTLSGHTHGGQMGIECGNFKWSPLQYRSHYWSGLYEEGKRYLYVNQGFGFIGFSGRIGIPPEITLFTLHRVPK